MRHHASAAPMSRAISLPDKRTWLSAAVIFAHSVFFANPANQAHATELLDSLDPLQQSVVSRLCEPLRFELGIPDYRACIRQRVKQALTLTDADSTALNELSFDEQFVVQRACVSTGKQGSDTFRDCLSGQLTRMREVPQWQPDTLQQHEQFAIVRQCLSSTGPLSGYRYRVCANEALEQLQRLPEADFSRRESTFRDDIQLQCSIDSATAIQHRQCLLNALGISFDTEPDIPTSTAPTESARAEQAPVIPTNTLPVEIPTVLAAPAIDLRESRVSPVSKAGSALALEPKSAPVAAAEKSQPRLSEQPEPPAPPTLTSELTLAVLLIGLVLTIVIKQLRKRGKANDMVAIDPGAHTEADHELQARILPKKPDLRPIKHTAPPPGLDGADMPEALLDQTYISPLPVEALIPALEKNTAQSMQTQKPSDLDKQRFGSWLMKHPRALRQRFATELLIYWIAYADNRYDPPSKAHVMQLQSPDEHNLIKRWAFMQDPDILSEAIEHLQLSANKVQRLQIINLLMALLIREQAISPIQNTLLRFVADALGTNRPELEKLFTVAFGHALPALPRPDKTLWWKHISTEQMARWDARAVARLPAQIRYRIALGQPLQGQLDEASVLASHQRAVNRCAMTQADQLGERERSLLATLRNKFDAARDELLEHVT